MNQAMPTAAEMHAARFLLRGVVQGVGLRPAVHRLATRLGLAGEARNVSGGLWIEVEGSAEVIAAFADLLPRSLPPGANVSAIEREDGEGALKPEAQAPGCRHPGACASGSNPLRSRDCAGAREV